MAPAALAVLVVDRRGALMAAAGDWLQQHGYRVNRARSGRRALEILARQEIHIVLLDSALPLLDDFAVLRQVGRSAQAILPYIIVVFASTKDLARQRVLDLGANEYMIAPLQLERLLERVQAVEKYLL